MRRITACVALLTIAAGPTGPRLRVVEGGELKAALAPGRPHVVHLWASWCRPCVAELPTLAPVLARASGNGHRVVVVSLDELDRAAEAERALRGLHLGEATLLLTTFAEAEPVLRHVYADWDGALPTTLVLDSSGRVVLAQDGFTRFDALERAIGPARPHASPSEEGGPRDEASVAGADGAVIGQPGRVGPGQGAELQHPGEVLRDVRLRGELSVPRQPYVANRGAL